MAKILLIAAMELELKPFLSQLRKTSQNFPESFQGTIHGHDVTVMISKIGQERAKATALLAVSEKPSLIISAGFGGGLRSNLKFGDIIVSSEVRNQTGERIACHPVSRNFSNLHSGVLLTVDQIVETPKEKTKLSSFADAVDMETFSVASIAYAHAIPFISVRIISDTVHESLPLNFNSTMTEGEVDPVKVAWQLVKRPHKIFPVMRLGFRSNQLSKSLSKFTEALVAHS